MKILLIEDEQGLAASVIDYLKNDGVLIEYAMNYDLGVEKALLYNYDCILLDITLPGGNGLDILKQLKKNKPDSGVIIISARNSIDDKIKGLDLGADDYLAKPFHLSELNARIKSVIRRRNFKGSDKVEYNELVVYIQEQNILVNGKQVLLTKKEYELLLYMLTNVNRVITKESIAEHLWGDDMDLADSYDFIYTHIKNIRKKLIDAGCKDYVNTIYGTGYKFGER